MVFDQGRSNLAASDFFSYSKETEMETISMQDMFDRLENETDRLSQLSRESPADSSWKVLFGDVLPNVYPRIDQFIGNQGLVAVVADNGRLWPAKNYVTLVHDMLFWFSLYEYPLVDDSGYARARELARLEFQKALHSQT